MNSEGRRSPKGSGAHTDAADVSNTIPATADDALDLLGAVATVLDRLAGASVMSSHDLGAYAVELAVAGWEIFPLRGKAPAIPKRAGGSGLLDATSDVDQVIDWWSGPHRSANIGARVPEGRVVLDVDPRAGGHESLAALEAAHRPLPATLIAYSGRGDGGRHLHWLAHPVS